MNKIFVSSKWKLHKLSPHAAKFNRWLKTQLSNLPRDFSSSRLTWEQSHHKSSLQSISRLATSKSRYQRSSCTRSQVSNFSTLDGEEKKRLPMNKIQVGTAPSPNLMVAKSKIGSLENTSYKPGGGDRIKIFKQKLQWKAKSKVGSLDNVKYKPGGGEKKIFDDKYYLKQMTPTNRSSTVSGTSPNIYTRRRVLIEEAHNLYQFLQEQERLFKLNRNDVLPNVRRRKGCRHSASI